MIKYLILFLSFSTNAGELYISTGLIFLNQIKARSTIEYLGQEVVTELEVPGTAISGELNLGYLFDNGIDIEYGIVGTEKIEFQKLSLTYRMVIW